MSFHSLLIISIESLVKENYRLKNLICRNISENILEKKLKGKYIRKKDIIFDKPHELAASYIKKLYLHGFQIMYFTTNSMKMLSHYQRWLLLYHFPRAFALENSSDEKSLFDAKREIYERIYHDFGYKYKSNIYILDTPEWNDWWKTNFHIDFINSLLFINKHLIVNNSADIINSIKTDSYYSKPTFKIFRFPNLISRFPRIERKPIITV
jgi:hypothetical protein